MVKENVLTDIKRQHIIFQSFLTMPRRAGFNVAVRRSHRFDTRRRIDVRAPLRRLRRLAPCMALVTRLERLFDLGGGALLHPWLRRQDEGRALAALEPVSAPLAALVRRWAWPMPRCWGMPRSGPGRLTDEAGVSISSGGDIVVCDAGHARRCVFRPDGTFVREWATGGGHPSSVVVSSADEVFVVDKYNHRVLVFSLDGVFVRSWGTAPGQCSHPMSVALHGDLLLICDFNDQIQSFALDGTFVRMWGDHDDVDQPMGLAVSSAGEVFVGNLCSDRVLVFDLDGAFLRSWSNRSSGSLCVAVSSAGEVFVSDGSRVRVFLADGTFVRCLHLPNGARGRFVPWGVAVTPSGDVVVCDTANNLIYLEPAGA